MTSRKSITKYIVSSLLIGVLAFCVQAKDVKAKVLEDIAARMGKGSFHDVDNGDTCTICIPNDTNETWDNPSEWLISCYDNIVLSDRYVLVNGVKDTSASVAPDEKAYIEFSVHSFADTIRAYVVYDWTEKQGNPCVSIVNKGSGNSGNLYHLTGHSCNNTSRVHFVITNESKKSDGCWDTATYACENGSWVFLKNQLNYVPIQKSLLNGKEGDIFYYDGSGFVKCSSINPTASGTSIVGCIFSRLEPSGNYRSEREYNADGTYTERFFKNATENELGSGEQTDELTGVYFFYSDGEKGHMTNLNHETDCDFTLSSDGEKLTFGNIDSYLLKGTPVIGGKSTSSNQKDDEKKRDDDKKKDNDKKDDDNKEEKEKEKSDDSSKSTMKSVESMTLAEKRNAVSYAIDSLRASGEALPYLNVATDVNGKTSDLPSIISDERETTNQKIFADAYAKQLGFKNVVPLKTYDVFGFMLDGSSKKSERVITWKNTGFKTEDAVFVIWYNQDLKRMEALPAALDATGTVAVKIPAIGERSVITIVKAVQ